ncbi:hypothetical protein COHA_009044 [Chlorella ohadii]|uniref:Phospholipase A2 domain-containing protein n=1 Tax=Chlorella ohadii TaxID=2649997 RepID=A0AAD5H1X2_9CHLO|nr:hypothetical protein COHA_009044 [Chlorella ohadii]
MLAFGALLVSLNVQGTSAAPAVSLTRKLGELAPPDQSKVQGAPVAGKSLKEVANSVASAVQVVSNGVAAVGKQVHAVANSASASYFSCMFSSTWQVFSTLEQNVFGKTCNHGNYCGASCVSNAPPVDNLDAACQEHDKCLAATPANGTCGLLGAPNCACDEMLHRKAQAIYENGKKIMTCAIFGLLCWKSKKTQAAGWVSASQYSRRACLKCPGVRRPGLFTAVAIGMSSVKLSPVKGWFCPTATGFADHYSSLTVPEESALNATMLDRALFWNLTDPPFRPVAPITLSNASANNATLLSQIGDVAVALDNFTALVHAGDNATRQAQVEKVATLVAQATAAAVEDESGMAAAMGTAQVLQNITALAVAEYSRWSSAGSQAGEAAAGSGSQPADGADPDLAQAVQSGLDLVNSLMTSVESALGSVADALTAGAAGDMAAVARALADFATSATAIGEEAGAGAEAAGWQPAVVGESEITESLTEEPVAGDEQVPGGEEQLLAGGVDGSNAGALDSLNSTAGTPADADQLGGEGADAAGGNTTGDASPAGEGSPGSDEQPVESQPEAPQDTR